MRVNEGSQICSLRTISRRNSYARRRDSHPSFSPFHFLAPRPLSLRIPRKGPGSLSAKGASNAMPLREKVERSDRTLGRVDLGNTLLDLASKLLNHIPPMIQGMERMRMTKPNLTGEEITDISAYLYFLKFFDEPGNATRGQYLFKEKGCINCHPLTGKGKEGEPGLDQFPQNISPVYLSEMIWNHGPVMIAQMVKLGMKWPSFEGTEMMDLLEYIKMNARGPKEAAFITPGNPRQGREVFITKGCVKCHAIRGEGGKVGEDLGKRAKSFLQEPDADCFHHVGQGTSGFGQDGSDPDRHPEIYTQGNGRPPCLSLLSPFH